MAGTNELSFSKEKERGTVRVLFEFLGENKASKTVNYNAQHLPSKGETLLFSTEKQSFKVQEVVHNIQAREYFITLRLKAISTK